MPIEIRELVIRASIVNSKTEESSSSESQSKDRESIIAECVDQILQILRKQEER